MHQEMPPAKHVPANNNSGWGVAALIVGIAIAFNVWSTWVHVTEYRDPQDPLWSYKTQPATMYDVPDAAAHNGAAPAADHGGAPAAAH
ncbi:MAG TPA: hypothetical protein VHQ45_17770 [Gemmatimonadaceae bacterium]|nr:hypothetical protein [Gemmatimonadaceae bacterium]